MNLCDQLKSCSAVHFNFIFFEMVTSFILKTQKVLCAMFAKCMEQNGINYQKCRLPYRETLEHLIETQYHLCNPVYTKRQLSFIFCIELLLSTIHTQLRVTYSNQHLVVGEHESNVN